MSGYTLFPTLSLSLSCSLPLSFTLATLFLAYSSLFTPSDLTFTAQLPPRTSSAHSPLHSCRWWCPKERGGWGGGGRAEVGTEDVTLRVLPRDSPQNDCQGLTEAVCLPMTER